MSSSSSASNSGQKFTVRIPKRNNRKSFHIMKFNSSLKIDPKKWSQIKMIRENNRKEFKGQEEELPKFGAGSEFGREAREEARRKKYGRNVKQYDPDAQPWIMRISNKREESAIKKDGNKKDDKKLYKGVQEGGVSDNTSYFVFTHALDGSFEAHPVKNWYNFTPKLTYKTLNAEEAEEKFADRGRILNHFAVMVNKKLKDQDSVNDDPDKPEKVSKSKKGSLKISDMDDWIESGDDFDSDDEGKKRDNDSDGDDGTKPKKSTRSKDSKKKKKKKDEADLEGNEDSDDGDGEGREVDYMSDASSESEEEMMEQADQKGVDQDEGLSKMLDSDSDEEEEEKEEDEEEEDDTDEQGSKNKKKKKKKDKKSNDKSDDETTGKKKNSDKGSRNISRATTPTPQESGSGANDEKTVRAEKRKALVDNVLDPNAEPSMKKSRLDSFGSTAHSSSGLSALEAALEEDVKRYLMRKPMTTMDLLKKFNAKKGRFSKEEVSKEQLTSSLVNVLKKVNPHKQMVRQVMYLSLKPK